MVNEILTGSGAGKVMLWRNRERVGDNVGGRGFRIHRLQGADTFRFLLTPSNSGRLPS
jgi:hypothetical protein